MKKSLFLCQRMQKKDFESRNWLDKNKFKEIESNKFGHKNKRGDFKYIGVKDLLIIFHIIKTC